MAVKITFLGAAGTVTGSKYLIEGAGKRILVDCGMFQGDRSWRERNWDDPDIDLASIDAVLVTHAHIDHVGLLPRYKRLGLKCPIYCTKATLLLSRLVLLDSAHLQEEDAEYRAERGLSRHTPPLPLYTTPDAEAALALFKTVQRDKRMEVLSGIFAEWKGMGHIVGACSIRLEIEGKVINFSGDIGRYEVPILQDPEPVGLGDLLLIESTYGDRMHPEEDAALQLAKVVNATQARGGAVIIPSFAVGRAQLLLYYLRELKEKREIPDIPVYVDSPMASEATSIYLQNPGDYDDRALRVLRQGGQPFSLSNLHFTGNRNESIAINSMQGPMIIISASGMLTGGRILHHLMHRISDSRNTVLFVGFQPPGGLGDFIKQKPKSVRIFRQEVVMRAEVAELSSLSAHADRSELLRWCHSCSGTPGKVAVVHGEPATAELFKNSLVQELGWNAFVAGYRQEYTL